MSPPTRPPAFDKNLIQDIADISWEGFWVSMVGTLFANPEHWAVLSRDVSDKVIPSAVTYAVQTWIEIQAAAGKQLGDSVEEYERTAGQVMLDAAAAGLSDFFGTQISASEIGLRGGTGARRELSDKLGRFVMQQLLEDVAPSGPATPEQGKAAAEKVIGFSLSTAIEGWLSGLLTHAPLTRFLANWGDLDEIVSSNLGLSQLSSAVTRPMVRASIIDPWEEWLNKKYRPRDLSIVEAVRGWIQGNLTDDQYFEAAAIEGWSRELAGVQKDLKGRYPFKEDLARMLRLGMITEERAEELFKKRGFLPEMAKLLMEMYRDLPVDQANTRMKTLARGMFADLEIDEPEFRSMMSAAGSTPRETEAWLAVSQIERGRPRRLARSQIERAFVEGVIEIDRVRTFYQGEGFDEPQIGILEAILQNRREAFLEAEEAARLAEELGDVPTVRLLPRSTAEEAFIRGLLREREFEDVLTEQGFEPDAIDIFVKLARERKEEREAREAAKAAAPEPALKAATIADLTFLGAFWLASPEPPRMSQSAAERAFIESLASAADLHVWFFRSGFADAERNVQVELAKRRIKPPEEPEPPEEPRDLPRSVAEKAFLLDIISEARFREVLLDQDFSPEDAEVILELARIKKAAAAAEEEPEA